MITIKRRDIFVLGEGLTQGLNDTIITVKAKYSINLTESRRKFVLSLHCNQRNSFLLVQTKPYTLCLGNISKDFAIDNLKKTRLNRVVKAS